MTEKKLFFLWKKGSRSDIIVHINSDNSDSFVGWNGQEAQNAGGTGSENVIIISDEDSDGAYG